MISKDSLIWAIQFIQKHSDGDPLPRIVEFEAFLEKLDELSEKIRTINLSQLDTGAHRLFIVPKDELSYRQATQLDPQGSIILSAIFHH